MTIVLNPASTTATVIYERSGTSIAVFPPSGETINFSSNYVTVNRDSTKFFRKTASSNWQYIGVTS